MFVFRVDSTLKTATHLKLALDIGARWTTRKDSCAKKSRQWINAGYNPCTKGMHKLQFPSFWWCGVGEIIANKCKSLISAYFPDPLKILTLFMQMMSRQTTSQSSCQIEHSTPLYSTQLHSTPLHSTPLHSTPLCVACQISKGNKQTAKVTCQISGENVWPTNAAVPKCTFISSIAGHCGHGSNIHIRHGGSRHWE